MKDTIEEFNLSDCKGSFMLSTIVIEELRSKTLSEARSIFLNFPKHFQQYILKFLEDLYLEDKLCEN